MLRGQLFQLLPTSEAEADPEKLRDSSRATQQVSARAWRRTPWPAASIPCYHSFGSFTCSTVSLVKVVLPRILSCPWKTCGIRFTSGGKVKKLNKSLFSPLLLSIVCMLKGGGGKCLWHQDQAAILEYLWEGKLVPSPGLCSHGPYITETSRAS